MHISGEQLFYLVQVLKDSLTIQMGYDWNFTSKRDSRKDFHDRLIKSLMLQDKIDIAEVDLSAIKKLEL